MRAISGTAADSSAKSCQSMMIPAARAIAGKWMKWLVEPPVATSPTIAFTIAFSSTTWASGRSPLLASSASRCTAARVSAWRSGVPGLMKAALGMCSPISSIIIWLELAVP